MNQKACRFRSVEACTFDGTPCPFCSSEVREKECELRVLSVLETFPQSAGEANRAPSLLDSAYQDSDPEPVAVLADERSSFAESNAGSDKEEEVSLDYFL